MITIQDEQVTYTSKEGTVKSMPIKQWLSKIKMMASDLDHTEIMPDGVKAIIRRGKHLLMIHQSPPALRSLKWIAPDSPQPFGPGTTYRDVTLALPYVITMAAFNPMPMGKGLNLSKWNECFFSEKSITSLDDEVCFPGLLNCSKWPDGSGRSQAAWVCTEKLNYQSLIQITEEPKRIRKGLSALLQCLFESGFNYSSEQHEGNSWYTATKDRDERIKTVENWEQESAKNPMFVLDVPWIKTGESLSTIANRVFEFNCAKQTSVTINAIQKIVANHV